MYHFRAFYVPVFSKADRYRHQMNKTLSTSVNNSDNLVLYNFSKHLYLQKDNNLEIT